MTRSEQDALEQMIEILCATTKDLERALQNSEISFQEISALTRFVRATFGQAEGLNQKLAAAKGDIRKLSLLTQHQSKVLRALSQLTKKSKNCISKTETLKAAS